MKSRDNDEKQITDSLKQMPVVKDKRKKDELYKQISSSLKEPQRVQASRKIPLVPIFSIVAVLTILLISVPFLMNEDNFLTNNSHDEAKMEKAVSDNRTNTGQMKPGKESDFSAAQSNKKNMLRMDKNFQSHVVRSIKDTNSIVYGAVANQQAQFIIPLTFIVSETEDLSKQYNKIGSYLKGKKRPPGDYMLAGAMFEMNRANGTVLVGLPKGFSLNSGAEANMFSKTVQSMFGPLQFDKAVFTRKVNLGPIGSVKALKINGIQNKAYKLYDPAQSERNFLVPVNMENKREITGAFEEMKQSEEEFHLQRTIPENIQISTHQKGESLQLTFAENIPRNQESLTMIESILMTAKSFGYKQVEFKNTGVHMIGPYQLTDPLNVPAGVNPIYTRSK
ncbi:hypothetical protein [Virgibacillus ihumii]|uniref:hypothetical protein n=1 Tax=Virgibacillus ihumii TaxID=2686091 RepID=UPI00157E1FBB|nr:hypothetical protein [Virgibacillus ihumii]